MSIVTYKSLKLYTDQVNILQPIVVKEDDERTRFLDVTLYNGEDKIEVANGDQVIINVKRSDGNSNAFAGTVNNDGSVRVPIPSWLMQVSGKQSCCVSVLHGLGYALTDDTSVVSGKTYYTKSGNTYTPVASPTGNPHALGYYEYQSQKLSSNTFYIEVQTQEYSGDDIEQDGNYSILVNLIAQVQALYEDFNDIVDTGLNNKSSDVKVLSEKAVVDNFTQIVKVTAQNTTLGDMATLLNTINNNGEHVLFDVSALGASMYLCTIFIDTNANVYRIFDMVVNRVAEGTYESSKLLTMAIANASQVATQAQIDSLQKQVDELGGSKVIENWDALGDLIQSGGSTDVISAGDTIDVNWIKSVLGTITSGATVSCSDIDKFINEIGEAEDKTYLFVYDGANWTYNGENVTLADYGLSVTGNPVTGDVMTIVTTVDKINYTFVGYDDIEVNDVNVAHNWLLEQTYAPDTKAYDGIEALFSLAQGETLPAGDYYIGVHSQAGGGAATLYFTISEAITASDAKLQFAPSGINWTSPYLPTSVKAYKNGTNTSVGSTINLSTTAIAGASDVSQVTGVTCHDSYYQVNFGNNNWERSNMRAWLNDGSQNGNFTPSYDFDRPSSYNLGKGFLYGIDPRVKALIQVSKCKFTAGYDNNGYTQGQTYTSLDKVFLLSMKEMSFDINTAEGNATDLYSQYCGGVLTNGAVADRAKYNKAGGSKNSYRWSRSADTGSANNSRGVNSSGSYVYSNAMNGNYFAPAFAIGKAS